MEFLLNALDLNETLAEFINIKLCFDFVDLIYIFSNFEPNEMKLSKTET